jgi:hypothetical protein
MNRKVFALAFVSLGLSALAMAADYKEPVIRLKHAAPAFAEAKNVSFNDEYKVEGPERTDRQIASEKDKAEVRPWLYKNELDPAY